MAVKKPTIKTNLNQINSYDKTLKVLVPGKGKNLEDFTCPICLSSSYKAITTNNGIEGPLYREWVTGYYCTGCSVNFGDPSLFSLDKVKQTTTEIMHDRQARSDR